VRRIGMFVSGVVALVADALRALPWQVPTLVLAAGGIAAGLADFKLWPLGFLGLACACFVVVDLCDL